MTLVFSPNGAVPAPLPIASAVPTAPAATAPAPSATFTEAELAAAGYSGRHTPPSYDSIQAVRAWDAENLDCVVSAHPSARPG